MERNPGGRPLQVDGGHAMRPAVRTLLALSLALAACQKSEAAPGGSIDPALLDPVKATAWAPIAGRDSEGAVVHLDGTRWRSVPKS